MLYCNDKKKFDLSLSNAKRIKYRLEELLKFSNINYELTDKDKFEISRIYCKSHHHFMCGHCYKVNEHELWKIEDEIKNLAYKIYKIIQRTDLDKNTYNHLKYNAQNLLRGHYPNLASLFFR